MRLLCALWYVTLVVEVCSEILSLCQYAINRSKVAFGRQGPEWEQDMVSEIDSALNAWKDSVPEHRKLSALFSRLVVLMQTVQCNGIRIERTYYSSISRLSCGVLFTACRLTYTDPSFHHLGKAR